MTYFCGRAPRSCTTGLDVTNFVFIATLTVITACPTSHLSHSWFHHSQSQLYFLSCISENVTFSCCCYCLIHFGIKKIKPFGSYRNPSMADAWGNVSPKSVLGGSLYLDLWCVLFLFSVSLIEIEKSKRDLQVSFCFFRSYTSWNGTFFWPEFVCTTWCRSGKKTCEWTDTGWFQQHPQVTDQEFFIQKWFKE